MSEWTNCPVCDGGCYRENQKCDFCHGQGYVSITEALAYVDSLSHADEDLLPKPTAPPGDGI